jgi:hypothetical protein
MECCAVAGWTLNGKNAKLVDALEKQRAGYIERHDPVFNISLCAKNQPQMKVA